MDAQELLVHDGRQRQADERREQQGREELELECEVVGQMTALVVSTQQPERLGVVDFERPQIEHTLDAEVAAVDVIAEEEVPGLSRVAANLEQLHQIVVLAVDIAAHGDWCVHLEQVGLGAQDLGARL